MIQISYTPHLNEAKKEERSSNDNKNNGDDLLERTFVLDIDEDAYAQLLHNKPEDCSVKRNQFEIFKFQPAGVLDKATRHDLWHAFDDRDEYHVAYMILKHGHLEGTCPKPDELHNELFA